MNVLSALEAAWNVWVVVVGLGLLAVVIYLLVILWRAVGRMGR